MNFKSRAQAGSSPSTSRRNRPGMWMAAVAVLLVGCGDRRDAEKTPSPSPSNAAALVSRTTQKSQAQLAQMFRGAGTVVSSVKTSEGFARIKPGRNTILDPQPNGLKITGAGHRPTVLLPGFRSGPAILEFVVQTPADTTLQLFYRLPNQRRFSKAQSVKHRTKAGKNVIYVELPALVPNSALRLDPGAVAGEYLLESFEVKTVPAG